MPVTTVIFAHGRESGPWGTKIRILAKIAEAAGCRVVSRDDRDSMDADLRVARMVDEAKQVDGPLMLVGSSMGGYVAAVAAAKVKPVGLFLMAPAFGMPDYAMQHPQVDVPNLSIVHGWDDDIVPEENVIAFARQHGAHLHLLPAGHDLQEQLEELGTLFKAFLACCLRDDVAVDAQGRVLATF